MARRGSNATSKTSTFLKCAGKEIRIPTVTPKSEPPVHSQGECAEAERLARSVALGPAGKRARALFPLQPASIPFKRQGEDPTRMFAGEGGPERTNSAVPLCLWRMPAKRLSTAFDSVTLYGRDPDLRPDIHGKVGNSGVSVSSLDDAKRLYSGFDLCDPSTSVSMTINGPAPMVLAFFLNAAIDQRCEKHIRAHGLEADGGSRAQGPMGRPRASPARSTAVPCPRATTALGLLLLGLHR